MKAIIKYKDEIGFSLQTIPVPKLIPNYVLIKVYAAVVNPSDEFATKNVYKDMKYDPILGYCVLGIEGSGIIEEVGENVPQNLKGKKVAFSNLGRDPNFVGTFCEYARAHVDYLFILEDDADLEESSGLFVNPLTVLTLLEFLTESNLNSCVNTPAQSSIGRILYKECTKRNINVINIVRTHEQVEALRKLGAQYVFDSSDPKSTSEIRNACQNLNARVGFNAVCGDSLGKMASMLPKSSKIVIYGVAGGPVKNLNPAIMLLREIEIEGIILFSAPCIKNKIKFDEYRKLVLEDMKSSKNMKVQVIAKFPLDKLNEVFASYKASAHLGKLILTPAFKSE